MPKQRFDASGALIVTKLALIRRQQELYALLLKKAPSLKMLKLEDAKEESGLQQFVNDQLKRRFAYATGIGVIEAVEMIAISQIDNGYEVAEWEDDRA